MFHISGPKEVDNPKRPPLAHLSHHSIMQMLGIRTARKLVYLVAETIDQLQLVRHDQKAEGVSEDEVGLADPRVESPYPL